MRKFTDKEHDALAEIFARSFCTAAAVSFTYLATHSWYASLAVLFSLARIGANFNDER